MINPALLVLLGAATAQEFSFQSAPAVRPATPAEIAAELRAHVDDLAATDIFSGVVRLEHGSDVLLDGAWGEASKAFAAANTARTRFNLASASKMFTAVVVAQLVEEGKLRYEDEVGRHLPNFGTPALRRITVHQLLTHTSGLGDIMTERWERSSRNRWHEVAHWLPEIASTELAFAPGARFGYSNAGYLLLGALVERITGESFASQLAQRVLEPAGMDRSGLFCRDEPRPDVARSYTRRRGGGEGTDSRDAGTWWNTLFANRYRGGPAGGAFATAADMTSFFAALRRGALLPEAALADLVAPKAAMGEGQSYGYGFILSSEEGALSYGHDGDAPGVSTAARHYPERGMTLVVLANYGDGAARRVAARFEALLRGDGDGDTPGFAVRDQSELSDEAQRELLHPDPLDTRDTDRYVRTARALIRAINDEELDAYESLMAPGYLDSLDDYHPWKHAFTEQLGHFGRIDTAWAPRRGGLKAGAGALFSGHAGGVSVIVRFEDGFSGSLTFSLDERDRVVKASCWFKQGFAEDNIGPDEKPIFELQ